METTKKIVYENYCGICGAGKITSRLCLVVTKRGEKTPIAVMLENYCRIIVTTENVSQHHDFCLLQEELAEDCVKGRQLSGKVDGEG